MANLISPDTVMISTALGRLDKLSTDEYIVAFGPKGRQFFATPNGYSATQLPMKILGDIWNGTIQKITWASYGSLPDSWFFACELASSTCTFHVGPDIPWALRQFIEKISPFPHLHSALRVQLGDDDSFVVWSQTSWACYGIPKALEAELCQMSWTHMRSKTVTRGSFKSKLKQATWHGDGSYYMESQEGGCWNFESAITLQAWSEFWHRKPTFTQLSELVLAALDPHAPIGETFAFIKKQHDAKEAPFVVHFFQDTIHKTRRPGSLPAIQGTNSQHIERGPDNTKSFQWAISKRDGRPHPGEPWELELKKGQKVKLCEDMGRNWHIVEGRNGVKGWVHRTWLQSCGSKVHKDPWSTYFQFQEDMRELLVPGQLCEFPALCEYVRACSIAACEALRSNTQLRICVHDLQTLLAGSGCYSFQWLKEERNIWHPDKFARYCHPDHKEHLKASAQEVFVLYGVLMDMCGHQEDN